MSDDYGPEIERLVDLCIKQQKMIDDDHQQIVELRTQLDQQARDHQTAVDQMRDQFSALAKALHDNVSTADANLASVDGRVTKLATLVALVNVRLGEIEEKIDALTDDKDEIDRRVTLIEERSSFPMDHQSDTPTDHSH